MYTDQTASMVKKSIGQFQERGIKSLILDLRDCGGGLLNQATQITDLFVSGGPLLRTREQDGKVMTMATAQAQNTDYQEKLVILVNRNTGAGAELIAGALQDLKRAVVIGERTAAVGMMAQSFPVGDAEASVAISVGELLRPSGMPIQGKGITPDVVVHDTRWDNPLLTGTHFPPGAMINMTYNGKSIEFKADESGAVSHITPREQGNPVSSVASNAMAVNSDAILKAAIEQLK